ncbi:hypothetical protein ACJ72_08115 [Emergomyces africanus]|uniref:Uncharacterized protein n=1 Tax=Emergomyces africanus TaxID=1955775 RepID=A0A1B7NLB8_9EURO|nr:hypothetical protein ACJ72_08115 [Emergomyces africanus]
MNLFFLLHDFNLKILDFVKESQETFIKSVNELKYQ